MTGTVKIGLMIILFMTATVPHPVLAQNPEFSTPAPGQIWENVMVTDIHGWDHSSVTIQWVGGGEALLIRRDDGATKMVTPDQILHVYDADGRDITKEVARGRLLGTQPVLPLEEPTPSGPGGNEVGGSNASPYGFDRRGATLGELTEPILFNFAVDVGAGYGSPTGTWFDGLNGGLNYQAGARILFNQRSFVRFAYRNQLLGKNIFEVYAPDLGDVQPVTVEFTVREYQFLFGRHSRPVQNNSVRTVGYGEMGISFMNHRAQAQDYRGDAVTETKTGVVLQGGFFVLLDKQWALDLSGGVTWKLGLSDDEGMGMLMGARAALVFMN